MEVDFRDPASVGTELIRIGTLLRLGLRNGLPEDFHKFGYTLVAAMLEPRVIQNMQVKQERIDAFNHDGRFGAAVHHISGITLTLHHVPFPSH